MALVTGGARGIGKAIALRLAEGGAKVAIVDLTDSGAETAREIEQATGRATTFVKADVSKEADTKAAVAAVEQALGPVDILVNNAGITRDGLLLVMGEGDWDAVLAVNLKGAFLMSKAVLRGMIKRRRGSIVSISSVVGQARATPARRTTRPPRRDSSGSPSRWRGRWRRGTSASTRSRRATSRPR